MNVLIVQKEFCAKTYLEEGDLIPEPEEGKVEEDEDEILDMSNMTLVN